MLIHYPLIFHPQIYGHINVFSPKMFHPYNDSYILHMDKECALIHLQLPGLLLATRMKPSTPFLYSSLTRPRRSFLRNIQLQSGLITPVVDLTH